MSESGSNDESEGSMNIAGEDLLNRIRDAVNNSHVALCCAGEVPIAPKSWFEEANGTLYCDQLTSAPVTIRWDQKDGKTISKLTFPIASEQTANEKASSKIRGAGRPSKKQKTSSDVVATQDHAALLQLIDDCAPAPFGKNGKDVLDDSYRKAVKLESDQFLTSFNPYDVGIIGAIAQKLLPGVAGPMIEKGDYGTWSECLSVVAELYKLNVGMTA